MDKYIFDEKNGLWYELQMDYFPPLNEHFYVENLTIRRKSAIL